MGLISKFCYLFFHRRMMCLLACDQNAGYPLKTYLDQHELVSYNEYYLVWEEMFRYNQVDRYINFDVCMKKKCQCIGDVTSKL